MKEGSRGLVSAVGMRLGEEAGLPWVVAEDGVTMEVGWPCPIVILATGFFFTPAEAWMKLPWKHSPTLHFPTVMKRSSSQWPCHISEMSESAVVLNYVQQHQSLMCSSPVSSCEVWRDRHSPHHQQNLLALLVNGQTWKSIYIGVSSQFISVD